MRVDGAVRDLDEKIELDRYVIHDIEIVVDPLVINRQYRRRSSSEDRYGLRGRDLTDAVETALELGDGRIIIQDVTQRDNCG